MKVSTYNSMDAELEKASASLEAVFTTAEIMDPEWYKDYLEVREKLEELRMSMIWSCELELETD